MDFYESFSLVDKLLFKRFASSVAVEMRLDKEPENYEQLIENINMLTFSRPFLQVNDSGKRMLTRLFPSWLLTQYQWMFAKPFPKFSAWMNAWVTHAATNWLMGNSTVVDLTLSSGEVLVQQGLKIDKCRFFETSGCLQTCIHACKIPTQRFFLEEMGLPVTLVPNVTDFSCRFEFGLAPVPLEQDPISASPCMLACRASGRSASICALN